MFRYGLLRIVLGLIICSCGGTRSGGLSGYSQVGGLSNEETSQLTEREQLLVKAERSWAKRDEYKQVKKAIEYWDRALALESDDTEIWNRISHAYLFLVELLCVRPELNPDAKNDSTNGQNTHDIADASRPPDGVPTESKTKKKLFLAELSECLPLMTENAQKLRQSERLDLLQKGKNAAEQVLDLLAPDVLKQIEESKASTESLSTLKTAAVPALYWRSTTLDRLSRVEGYVERVFNKDALTVSMAYCLDKSPRYDHAGPHRYFGSFFARPLSIADKNLKRSKMHFERAIAIAPGFFANRYAFARDYAVMAQDRKTFETQLRTILEADIETDPSSAPENRIYRQKAETLLRLASEYFE